MKDAKIWTNREVNEHTDGLVPREKKSVSTRTWVKQTWTNIDKNGEVSTNIYNRKMWTNISKHRRF